MIDLREYANAIRDEVGDANYKDQIWKFTVKHIGSQRALICWTYLDHLGEPYPANCFQITTTMEGCNNGDDVIVWRDPDGKMIDAVLIEEETKYSAAITPERAIRWAVRNIVRHANSRY